VCLFLTLTPSFFLSSAAAEKMFGYPSKEIIGKNIKQLMPASYAANHDDCKVFEKCLKKFPFVLINSIQIYTTI
jgi:PAS domain S-box-containing protein